MAANQKLIDSMLKCDGTNGNCRGCVFAEHPECRNAMAHHAGALIQMQDVVIENSGAIQRKLMTERMQLKAELANANRALEKTMEEYKLLTGHLRDKRDCSTCNAGAGVHTEEEKAKRCEMCRAGESLWELDTLIISPPEEENPCDECEEDDCEGCEHYDVKRID